MSSILKPVLRYNVNIMTEQTQAIDQAPAESAAGPAPGTEDALDPSLDADQQLDQLDSQVESILISTSAPQTSGKLAEWLGLPSTKPVKDAIKRLNTAYAETHRSFRIEQVGDGWQILTLPQHADLLKQVHRTKSATKLSPAAMETLAIIAYKQPILRANIEAIRGVASGEVIRGLMDRHMVKITGRAEELGRPMLYGTTKSFLETFGLATIKDLPKTDELLVKP